MRQPTRTPVRAGLVYLAAVFLTVGLWATLVPSSFYEEFPGGRHWVAGDGPYNAHVVGDTGVGFVAVGVVALLAAVWMETRLVLTALVAAVVHNVPHLLYHLRHPNEVLGTLDASLSNASLAFGVFLAVALLVVVAQGVNRSRASGPQMRTTAKERTASR